MIDGIYAWWRREMTAMLPKGLTELGHAGETLIVRPVPGDWTHAKAPEIALSWRQGRKTRDLGQLNTLQEAQRRKLHRAQRNGRLQVELLVPQQDVLETIVSLPLAAKSDVAEALRYEIDRATPFQADEIYYAVQDHHPVPQAERLDVSVIFVPRATVAPALQAMSESGLVPDRLEQDGDGQQQPNMLPVQSKPWTMGTRLTAGLALAAFLCGMAWLWLEWQTRANHVEELRAAVATERRAALSAQDRQVAAATGEGAVQAAYALRQNRPLAIAVLADATALLPDDSWVERIVYDGKTLELTGFTAQATRLIGLFDAHPRFRNPVFRTPITRARDEKTERFALAVEVVVEPADPASTKRQDRGQ